MVWRWLTPAEYNGTEYKYKYNGIERTESLGLCIDLALYRGLDPVLGKWYQADPKAESIGYIESLIVQWV